MVRSHTPPTPSTTIEDPGSAGAPGKTTAPAKSQTGLKANGPLMGDALRAAQDGARSTINTAASASGYQRLVRNYDEMRKDSFFTNRVSGVLVSGASLTPRIQEDGSVQVQTAEHYTTKWESLKPEGLRASVDRMLAERDANKRGEALALAVDVPLARALQHANRELEPSSVKQNEATRSAKEFVALNGVSPMGDPTTGRPVFAQVWLDNGSGGQMPVYAFKKSERSPTGPQASFLGLRPGLDEKGGRTVELVKGITFQPGITERGSRFLSRDVHVDGGPVAIETSIQQQKFLAEMEAGGWAPVNTVPPENADLPVKYRGMSEVDVSSRAMLALAKATLEKDVVMAGFRAAHEGAPEPAGLSPFERGLVQDYRHLAERLHQDAGLPKESVKILFTMTEKTTKALGALAATVEPLRRDPKAMDPITEFRLIATDLIRKSGQQGKAQEVYRLFDQPEDSFRAAVGESKAGDYMAADNIRKAVLEQLAKDLTTHLAPDTFGKSQWTDEASGRALNFPDGSPRVSTPFDEALARGGAHFDAVRKAYYELVQSSMNAASDYIGVRLVLASRAGTSGKMPAISMKEASALAKEFAGLQQNGQPMAPERKALVERTLNESGAATAYIDELMRTHTQMALVSAHRAGLSPAEFQRAMLANAQDNEPWDLEVRSYKVYSYNSVPVPSGPALYIVPEQETPGSFNPADSAALDEMAANRTWRVVTLSNEDGRPAPVVQDFGLSTKEMLDIRLEANQRNVPVLMSRKPLSENLPLGQALAKTYNLPVISSADPIDGTRGRYAAVGLKISGTPVASTVAPGYYKALTFSKAPLVEKVEPVQLADEGDFAASFGLERAKGLVKENPAHLAALEEMSKPERASGVYRVQMTDAGIKAFGKQRMAAISAMTAARTSSVNTEFNAKATALPPDARGGIKASHQAALKSLVGGLNAKNAETSALVARLQTLAKQGFGKVGYIGFAPPLGAGNPAVRIRKPPLELRFSNGSDGSLELMKPRLNKQGLSVHLDAYLIED